MALLCRVVAVPSSSCVAAARWFLGIEKPLNETETERELQREQRRDMYSHGLGCHHLVIGIMGRVACRADGIGTGIGRGCV